MKNYLNTLIVSISLILITMIITTSFVSYKKNNQDTISATGSAKKDFVSDLIVWRGYIEVNDSNLKDAYTRIKKESEEVKSYLLSQNINPEEIVFSSVAIEKRYDSYYDEKDRYISTFAGYELKQDIVITSKDVDRIENVSRDITTLIDKGILFVSLSPEYFYSGIDDLKLEILEEASQNAKKRAELMAKSAGSRLKKLKEAKSGVFQIIAKNSNDEDFSYGGSFNTNSKEKTMFITTKLVYTLP